MIAVSALQFRADKALAGKRASECAAGLLSSCAKWRHRCEQKYWDQLVHATVLDKGRRVVQSHSRAACPRLQSDDSRCKIGVSIGFRSRTSRRQKSAATHTAHHQCPNCRVARAERKTARLREAQL